MSETPIICKATRDTFVRFGIVIAALLGFAGYFFYDGSIGYRAENEQICAFQQFARLGELAVDPAVTDAEWEKFAASPLLQTERQGDGLVFPGGEGHVYPLPADCEAATSFPEEARDRAAMKDWNACWKAYSGRRHFSITPPEHMHDAGAIQEQWVAGGIFTLLGLVLLYFALRTGRRELSLHGDKVTAAGCTFTIPEIESIDLRQWGPGFKGVAYFTVGGKKVRVDGMTYGGFAEAKGQPAEKFMKAVLAQYKGEVVEVSYADGKAK